MIIQRTILDQIEITRSGNIQLRFGLLLEEDGIELDCKWHRTVLSSLCDISSQIDTIDKHLQQMGRQSIDKSTLINLDALASIVWPQNKKEN